MSKYLINALSGLLLTTMPMPGFAEQRFVPQSDIQVEDGDTILVKLEGAFQKIQLTGIDAPEDVENPKLAVDLSRTKLDKQRLLKLGKVATQKLVYLVESNAPFVLHFNPKKRDRYGRIPGDIVNPQGESISALMIKNGYAVVILRSTHPDLIKRLKPIQQQAIKQQKGLWGLDAEASKLWGRISN